MLIVCPFRREAQLERILVAWRAQTVPAELLLVSDARSSWAKHAEEEGAFILSGLETIGAAKNAALRFARARGEPWITVWDDDDYYGPRYVEQTLAHIDDAVDVLTQGIGFVRFDDGLYLFEKPLHFCPGHCTTMRVSAAPEFHEVSLGEDVAWSRQLDWTRVRELPPWHSVYHREGADHAFDSTRVEFINDFGPCRRIGDVPDAFVDEPRDLNTYPFVEVPEEMVFRALEKRLRTNQGEQHV